MRQEQSPLAKLPHAAPSQALSFEQTQRLELIGALQTTLVLEQLLELFSGELQKWVPHDGFYYCNRQHGLEVQIGRRALHRCHYGLALEGQALGELALQRRKRFSEPELKTLESLLCCLVYPLRNALLYYQALKLCHTDPLTGVYNRTALAGAFEREWKLAQRQNTPLSLLILDIDYFKKINDTYGHPIGDEVLRRVAHNLKQTVRTSDMVFRYGGEEFVILLSNTALKGARMLAERLRVAVANMEMGDIAPGLHLTASLGVAALSHPQETPEQLLKRADEALYHAKRQGRDRVAAI